MRTTHVGANVKGTGRLWMEGDKNSMGIEASRGQVPMQREIGRLEVEKAIARSKCGKAAGTDGITAEMLKYGGDTMVEWMLLICERAWKKGDSGRDSGLTVYKDGNHFVILPPHLFL